MKARRGIITGALGLLLGGVALAAAAGIDSLSASNWQMGLRVELGGTRDTLARLGVAPDASADYDAQYDVPHPPSPPGDFVELIFPHTGGNWPTLLSTRYAADITGPVDPGWLFKVQSSFGSGLATVRWDTSAISQLPGGYVVAMKDSTAGTIVLLRHQSSYTFTFTGPRTFRVWATYDATMVEVKGQWNLLSVPRNAIDMSRLALFPGAASPAFRYDSAYEIAESLSLGTGYWVKFDAPAAIAVSGTAAPSTTLDLHKGWNLVGSLDHVIVAPFGGTLASPWYAYDGAYVEADSLRPGRGYWIKSSSDYSIVLGPGGPGATWKREIAGCTRIVVTDALEHCQTLYVGMTDVDPDRYALPPLPPEGAFDVRFSTGTTVCKTAVAGTLMLIPRIVVRASAYPLTLRIAGVPRGMDARILNMGSTPVRLQEQETIVIHGPAPDLEVAFSAEARPMEFSLSQNYPNPFNPVSRCIYTLPERARARFIIRDLLGREVTRLVDRIEEAGVYEITIDGGRLGLASGVYLYTLQATGTESDRELSTVKKFMYVK